MGLKENLINYLYENMKHIIIKDVVAGKRDGVLQGYRMYLEDRFANIENYADDLEKAKSVFLPSEQKFWQDKDGNYKYISLMPDEAYKKIKLISDYAYANALKKVREGLETTLAAEDAQAKEQELSELLKNVGDQNKGSAKLLVSESILDLEYSAGLTEYTSLRIGPIGNVKN